MQDEILISVGPQQRVSLGRLAEHKLYIGSTDPETGIITLRPVEVVPAVVGERPATLAGAAARTANTPRPTPAAPTPSDVPRVPGMPMPEAGAPRRSSRTRYSEGGLLG